MSDSAALVWRGLTDLSNEERAAAVSWLHDMDPEYYSLFHPERTHSEAAIARLLAQTDSELGPTRFLRRNEQLAGLATWFPADELFARRIASLKAMLALCNAPSNIKIALKALPRPLDELPFPSLYLSKVYVSPQLRRSGLAEHMLHEFIAAGNALGWSVCLNVHSDNETAIALYRKLGFCVPEHVTLFSQYLLLTHFGGRTAETQHS